MGNRSDEEVSSVLFDENLSAYQFDTRVKESEAYWITVEGAIDEKHLREDSRYFARDSI